MSTRKPMHRRALGALLAAVAVVLVLTLPAPSGQAGKAPGKTTVVLKAPKPGDVTYGRVQVRIAKRAPRVRARGRGVVFASRVGDLAVVARSGRWSRLRKDTRVNVIVTPVKGASSNLRNVTFFIHRRGGRRASRGGGSVEFTIANARPNTGSFWVRRADRRGRATIFNVTNAVETAVDNWSRYVRVLQAARALRAAADPTDVNGQFRTPPGARTDRAHRAALRGMATGGHRLSPRGRAISRLLFATLGDRASFQQVKRSPLAASFIASDLKNPALARRFREIVELLPDEVPDSYAAASQTEKRFSHIRAPRISRHEVVIADRSNAASQAAIESPGNLADTGQGARVIVHMTGSGSGTVKGRGVNCPGTCSLFYATGDDPEFDAIEASGSTFEGWQGCTGGTTDSGRLCKVTIPRNSSNALNVYANFNTKSVPVPTTQTLSVSLPGSGSGTVTSSPAGLSCPGTCSRAFADGQTVTLTATPGSGSVLSGWTSGCDSVSGHSCTVVMSDDKTVAANFAPAPSSHSPPTGSDGGFGSASRLSSAGTNAVEGDVDVAPGAFAASAWLVPGVGIQVALRGSSGGFGAPAQVNAPGAGAPQVAISDAGKAYAMWTEPGTGGDVVRYATRAQGASALSSAVTISDPGTIVDPVVDVDPDGNVTFAWIRDGVVETRTIVGGTTVNAVVDISSPGARELDLAAADDGVASAVWTRWEPALNQDEVQIATRETVAGSFSIPFVATANAGPSDVFETPSIGMARNDGSAFAAWSNVADPSDPKIEGAGRAGSGFAFGGLTMLSDAGGLDSNPDVAVGNASGGNAGGDVTVVWGRDVTGAGQFIAAENTRRTGTWSGQGNLGATESPADPSIAMNDAGNSLVAYEGASGGTVAARTRVAGMGFAGAETVSMPNAGAAGTGLDASSVGTVAWTRFVSGTEHAIEAATNAP